MDATTSISMLNRVQELSETGRNAAVVAELGAMPVKELEQSPTLSLLFGVAQGRLGRHSSGKQWVATALETARARGDAAIEARALNVSGAIAFDEGRVDDAAGHFANGLAEAQRQGDRETVGKCSNNLGIIAHLRGEYGRAIGSYTMAMAAYQQVGRRKGVAITLHNMSITYRDERNLAKALETEERAGEEAMSSGDLSLQGLICCGRGEIRLKAGDAEVARLEIQRALAFHREVGDVVREAEDLRALAEALDLMQQPVQAEAMLRDVIARARKLDQSLLTAQAERDLARVLHRQERDAEAGEVARRARDRFESLGAASEVRRLDGFLRELVT